MSVHELARFFTALADTGNFALACEAVGRAKSGLYKRRARDPIFAADCQAALAQFRIGAFGAGVPPPAFRGRGTARRVVEGPGEDSVRPERSRGALLTAPGALILSATGKRPQLRRSPPGRLTPAGIEAFLKTLAATANIRFSAHSVGVAPSSIYRRRRVDLAFARAMERAIAAAMATLELRLIEDADRTFDPDPDHEAWLAAAAEPPAERMSIHQALWFLSMRGKRRR